MMKLDEMIDELLDSAVGDLSVELAERVLRMRFSEERAARYTALTERNKDGALTATEREALDMFVTANTFVMILKSKARRSLVRRAAV